MTAADKRGDDEPSPDWAEISGANQITLPVAALDAAHLKPGDTPQVEAMGDGMPRPRRVRDPFWDAFNQLAGSMPGLAEETNLEELRNEWER